MGAMIGITTVTGIPRSFPWYANAKAWFPALAAITPIFCWGYIQKIGQVFIMPISHSDTNSEGLPFNYNCIVLKFHIAQRFHS